MRPIHVQNTTEVNDVQNDRDVDGNWSFRDVIAVLKLYGNVFVQQWT